MGPFSSHFSAAFLCSYHFVYHLLYLISGGTYLISDVRKLNFCIIRRQTDEIEEKLLQVPTGFVDDCRFNYSENLSS